MKKIRVLVPVLLVSLGAVALASCGSYPGVSTTSETCSTPGGSKTTPRCDGAATGNLPCDVWENACQPCVSAHSTVRLLRSAYSGPLYQVERADATTKDILAVNGYADAAGQDSFCTGSICTVKIIYDQSTQKNDLTIAPPGGNKGTPAFPAKAKDLPVKVGGHSAYGLRFRPGQGYRTGCTGCPIKQGNGTAKGDEPETMYMVTSQQQLANGCCFDYGNAETTSNDDGNGTMEAVYFGGGVVWGRGSGNDVGPWVMADLENGLYAGWENKQDRNISTNKPLLFDFVTAMVVGDTQEKNCGKGRFALYGGDATSGTLTEMWDGIRPEKNGYNPMQKQGSIILSTGGDNSDGDGGLFYEGAMVNGASTKETADAIQASIVAAGYGKETP
jgi:non-reducing end alpha-L-arabinofuranosidase